MKCLSRYCGNIHFFFKGKVPVLLVFVFNRSNYEENHTGYQKNNFAKNLLKFVDDNQPFLAVNTRTNFDLVQFCETTSGREL